ncbi:hypothetical protein ACVWY0_001949 [Arthrobacter sp. UYNi723]
MTCSGPLSSIQNCWGVQPAAIYGPPGLLFFDLEGVRLLLERGAPSSVLYLEVEDVRASISVLHGRGVEVIALPHVIFHHGDAALGPAGTDEWMAFISDSEGNTQHSPQLRIIDWTSGRGTYSWPWCRRRLEGLLTRG